MIEKLIGWLQLIQTKLSIKSDEINYVFNPLSPIANADDDNHYSNALGWALKTRKQNDIKNIALTGPYGSGKSSILKTFKAKYEGGDLHFLNISLATFKEESNNEPENAEPRENLLRQIELSILQQIFYHEEDHKIPDSRFKKIKNYKRRTLTTISIGLFLLLFACTNLAYPNLISMILRIRISSVVNDVLHYSSLLISTVGLSIIIYKSIRFLTGIRISKLNFHNAEIAIDEKVNKSILNHYIDEILYFFEVRPYNVVIIEDLDRFEQTEIFTKLREINLLINNSKKIKKDVVFIYAVRDDMFEDKERTKFFDFIIPVIPVINSSNSSDKLIVKRDRYKYKLSDDLIESVALFIDDMRLLHNITNEFYIYYQKLNKTLNQDKLLSILVYKNIFPNDFTALSNNEGNLYRAINSKWEYVAVHISKLEAQVSIVKEEIKNLEAIKIKDFKELRALYVYKYVEKLSNFESFIINDKPVDLGTILLDGNFEYFINNKLKYSYYYTHYSSVYKHTDNVKLIFKEIENEVDPSNTYVERASMIERWSNNKIDLLKKRLLELERDKTKVRRLKLKEILSKESLNFISDNIKQQSLVSVLLRNGYIDEDYLDYISIFYEGSITKTDHQFLLNVKSQIPSDFSYKLHKIDKLVEKINPIDFDKEFILNYDLLNHLLQNTHLASLRDLIISQFKNESEISIKFIDGFLENTNNTELFVKLLCKSWANIWNYINEQSNFPEEKKFNYFKLIVEFADVKDITIISKGSPFVEFILNLNDFLMVTQDFNKLKEIIAELEIKFTNLDTILSPKELLEFIYQNNHYFLNKIMVEQMIKLYGYHDQVNFDSKNYYSILNSGCTKLISYVRANINLYVDNIYLLIETNTREVESSLIELLNTEELTLERKEKIIEKVTTKIQDITSIEELEVVDKLLDSSAVIATWENISICYEYNENTLSSSLITFINQQENAIELSKTKIPYDEDQEEQVGFVTSLIEAEEFVNLSYSLILQAVPTGFEEFDFEELSSGKVNLLIEHKVLTLNSKNYNLLKTSFDGLHIKLIEFNKIRFLIQIRNFNLEADDILNLLTSKSFTSDEKNKITNSIEEDLISSSDYSIREIGGLILKNSMFEVSDVVLKLILSSRLLTVNERIVIFSIKHGQLNEGYIPQFLNSLGERFSEITINGKRPLIENNEGNRRLVEILKNYDYISKYELEKKGIRISTYWNR